MARKRKRRARLSDAELISDEIRRKFAKKQQGYGIKWYPMACRTAVKFLKSRGLTVRAPRPGYETEVTSEQAVEGGGYTRYVSTILTNRGGKCEFTFRYR